MSLLSGALGPSSSRICLIPFRETRNWKINLAIKNFRQNHTDIDALYQRGEYEYSRNNLYLLA